MKVSIITKEMTSQLEDFIGYLSLQRSGLSYEIVYDAEEKPQDVARYVRTSNVLWFNGIGSTLVWLLEHADKLEGFPRGVLYASQHDTEYVAHTLRNSASILTDVICGSSIQLDALCVACAVHKVRLHNVPSSYILEPGCVFPMDEWESLRKILRLPSKGNLTFEEQVEMINGASLCSGVTANVGGNTKELRDHLRAVGGCVPTSSHANPDTLLVWHANELCDDLHTSLIDAVTVGNKTVVVRKAGSCAQTQQALLNYKSDSVVIENNSQFIRLRSVSSHPSAPLLVDNAVSVVIPTYNSMVSLEKALKSVMNQTYSNLQVIVVDDGSTDDTEKLINSIQAYDSRVDYVRIEHAGRSAARNAGIAHAKSDIIAWLDADDEAFPGWIAAQIAKMRDVDVCYSSTLLVNASGSAFSIRKFKEITKDNLPRLLFAGLGGSCPLMQSSTLVKKRVYDEIGLYSQQFDRCEDYDLWVRAAIHGNFTFSYCDIPLACINYTQKSQEVIKSALNYYVSLFDTLKLAFTQEQLVSKSCSLLEISPQLEVAKILFSIATLYGAEKDGELFKYADKMLDNVVAYGNRLDMLEAVNLRKAVFNGNSR